MNAHPRHLPIELDGFLVMDMEDVYNPTFCWTEADARDIYRELDQRSARVFRMADGRHREVTADFIPDEDEREPAGGESPASLLRWYHSRVL